MLLARTFLLLMLTALSANVLPQPALGPQYDPAAAQKLLDGMRPVAGARRVDEGTLIRLRGMGLPRSPANVLKVEQLLRAVGDRDATRGLIELLATLYVPNTQSAANDSIVKTLQGYIHGSDPTLATAALLAYSRSGAKANLLADLDYALKRGLIDENSYSQELAINMPYAAPDQQYEAALRLRDKNNAFGAMVLTGSINRRETIARMLPRTREVLQSFLLKNEPEMPKAIGEFSGVDGLAYAGWLETMAYFSEVDGKTNHVQFIFDQLSKPDTDARKALAYMSSPNGARLMKSIGSRRSVAPLIERAREPSRHFPGHPIFGPLTEQMDEWQKGLKD